MAVAAIIRSTTRPRGLRPAAMTAAATRPKIRAASGVEGHRVEFVLGTLQYFQAPGAFGVLVVGVLIFVTADLMRAGRQFRERDGADCHLIGKLPRIDPAPQDQDIGVEDALPERFTAHTGCSPHSPGPRPGQPGTCQGQPRAYCATWRRT